MKSKTLRIVAALTLVAVLGMIAGVALAQVTSLPTYVAGRFGSQSGPSLTAASLSGCGTSPTVVGNETGAVITIGSAPGAACTVTFTAAYGNAPACLALNQTTAGILLEGINLNPSPTELVPERETSPATAGSVVLPQSAFLSWQRISAGANVSGWVRKNAVMPLYESSRH